MKRTYEEEANNLIQAIDIAIDAFKNYPPNKFQPENIEKVVNIYLEQRNNVLNPQPEFRKVSSLKYTISDVFIYFQESGGKTVDYFWKEIKKAGLPYKRENKIAKILKRRTIKNVIEYEFIIDILVPYQQEGLINSNEALLLNKMIADFEKKELNN
jgi:hypothetical protein